MAETKLRLGILGAARITPFAVIRPARNIPGVQIAAIAARNPVRARRFARRYGVPQVHDSYAALVEDAAIDAVYNPLPNSLHATWTLRALQAGKHVLCEKPLAANAEEAARMAEAAKASGRVLAEAFHYRYHPLAARMKAIVDSGELGRLRHIQASFCVPVILPGNIRFRYGLGGGSTMDVGCYTINLVRYLAGTEPEVTHSRARLLSPQIDRYMEADLRFPGGVTGHIRCAHLSSWLLAVSAKVVGDGGELKVWNPFLPHLYHRLRVRSAAGSRTEHVPGMSTYAHQLQAFVNAVRGKENMPTDAADAIANMRVIDAVYRCAGLRPRGQ